MWLIMVVLVLVESEQLWYKRLLVKSPQSHSVVDYYEIFNFDMNVYLALK